MYEKKLNGILADEMGLGKTIQTIALLAHLACEKGNKYVLPYLHMNFISSYICVINLTQIFVSIFFRKLGSPPNHCSH